MVNRKGTKGKGKKNSTPNKNAFSFIEAMVVIAIIAILIIASQPLFRQFSRSRHLKSGANVIVSALRTTRGKAITDRKIYKTVLDTINQAVGMYDSNDNSIEKWEKLPDFVEFDRNDSDWYIQNASGDVYYIGFKPNGGVDTGATQKVVIKEKNTGDTRLIQVGALTGRIKIE
ncbi:MAG TPA: hypothetical protein EYP78_00020 [Candidatus Omnitrophica bacterium]|nr:hypothetical protein [Candidatus Omnitrophota bacterium]